jgi:hypothetical protein
MNGGDWVPFHKRLAKGPKKSIPRGIRFVLLELSLESRANHGVLDLPVEWDTVSAIHDLLGGDLREIRKALQIFSLPDSTGVPTLEIIKDAVRHRVVLTKWEDWAGPKTSTERVRDHRENQRLAVAKTFHRETDVTPTGQDITEQNKREREAPARQSSARLKSVPPPPPDPVETPEQAAADDPEPPSSESGFDLAKRVYSELWTEKYREPYEFDFFDAKPDSENRVLQELGARALNRGADAERYLRHVVKEFLRDRGHRDWLIENRHPAKAIKSSFRKYGEPPAAKSLTKLRAAAPAEPVAPALSVEQQGQRAAEAMKAMGKIGMGGRQ